MHSNKKEFIYIVSAFLILCMVSLYRQLSIRFLEHDHVRPFIVYTVYLILTGFWLYSLNRRITQKTMLFFLRTEVAVMIFWLTVRFLQDSWLYQNIHIMRLSGYLIAVPLMLIPLLGVYISLCLGTGDSFRFRRTWYLLLIPALTAILLNLTNEYHHLICKVLPDEPENLYFHPNYGIIFPIGLGGSLIILRILMIYSKTRGIRYKTCYKVIPLMIGAAMPLWVLPYLHQGFLVNVELIELTAKLFFLEILSWESCIILGLVPVNTQYRMVFERSTVGMRIIDEAGVTAVCSEHAKEVSPAQLETLKQNAVITDDAGIELHLHRLRKGYLIYQQDVSQLYDTVSELNKTAEELQQENELRQKEFTAKSEETAVAAKNRIYDRITAEVGEQLSAMTELIRHADTAHREELLKKLCLTGTYVKRRCNLRLIEQETGSIDMNELYISLRDLIRCMNRVGISADLDWSPTAAYPAEYAVAIFDRIESELEKQDFQITEMHIRIADDAQIRTVSQPDETAYSFCVPMCAPDPVRISESGGSGNDTE